MTVCLYGPIQSSSSFGVVTRGFQEGLSAAGVLDGVVPVEDLSEEEHHEHVSAPIAVMTGPITCTEFIYPTHRERMIMVAPNSDLIPKAMAANLNRYYQQVLVPSRWAKEVLDPVLAIPAVVVPHGVTQGFCRERRCYDELVSLYRAGEFRVLHLSTSARQRKGTVQLVQAWSQLMQQSRLPERARLALVLDTPATLALLEELSPQVDLRGITFLDRLGSRAQDMAALMRTCHVVCQPSRGEGFGMTPLEARACGVVTVATRCTGHSEHMPDYSSQGVVVVEHGSPAPIDDVPGARAPQVTSEAIAEALRYAYTDWEHHAEGAFSAAEEVRMQWSWPQQLRPFAERLRSWRTA